MILRNGVRKNCAQLFFAEETFLISQVARLTDVLVGTSKYRRKIAEPKINFDKVQKIDSKIMTLVNWTVRRFPFLLMNQKYIHRTFSNSLSVEEPQIAAMREWLAWRPMA